MITENDRKRAHTVDQIPIMIGVLKRTDLSKVRSKRSPIGKCFYGCGGRGKVHESEKSSWEKI